MIRLKTRNQSSRMRTDHTLTSSHEIDCGKTSTCENITFPLRSVITCEHCHWTSAEAEVFFKSAMRLEGKFVAFHVSNSVNIRSSKTLKYDK